MYLSTSKVFSDTLAVEQESAEPISVDCWNNCRLNSLVKFI
jgi:hypothetical protein